MTRIIVFGFPHCGTSIMKSIISHIDDVEEYVRETAHIPPPKGSNKFAVCKYPFAQDSFLGTRYKDFVKIFIVRNPLYVFSSLNKRYNYKIPSNHSIETYVGTLNKFINCQKNDCDNLYTIRYEDMFDDNYKELRKIFDSIGFEYDDSIFDNSKYENKIVPGVKLSNTKPKNTEHGPYRTWQINQPFVSNNVSSKLDLTDKQKEVLLKNETISKVYPNLQQDLQDLDSTS